MNQVRKVRYVDRPYTPKKMLDKQSTFSMLIDIFLYLITVALFGLICLLT